MQAMLALSIPCRQHLELRVPTGQRAAPASNWRNATASSGQVTAASMLAVQAWRRAMPGAFWEYTRPGMGFLPLLRALTFLLSLWSLGEDISSDAGGLLAAEVNAAEH